VAFGISGDSDSPDAMFLQETRLEYFRAAIQEARRLRNVACDNENLLDAGICREPTQEIIENRKVLDKTKVLCTPKSAS
jgi:hypothetical protein